ncbi:FxsA family protein [Neoaquamicrobium sediminum]|uniref:FxsA family protein n=1 Tax=Neoaquamicrobium sediminum TaxID=1849104 RepID=A0ABV3WMS6_9HYPH|nr:FxsA family protein [Mesorhizobium sediminum]NRC53688.1 membrane protein FxsA [Mesorhizobium sediminum]
MAFPFIPLLLLALPLAEIAVFVMVGSEIGALATVGLVIATTILGSILLRVQGFGILTRIRETMDAGGSPGRDLVHGVMVLLAGVLLFLPGFVTDALGFLLFIPPIRDLGWRLIRSRITIVTAAAGPGGFRRPGRGRTIDLDEDDFARDDKPQPQRPSITDDR